MKTAMWALTWLRFFSLGGVIGSLLWILLSLVFSISPLFAVGYFLGSFAVFIAATVLTWLIMEDARKNADSRQTHPSAGA